MKIDYDGHVYEFAFTDLDVGECEAIEKFTGAKGLGDWSNQLAAANTKALQALWWAMRRHDGEDPGPIGRADPSLRPIALNAAVADAEAAEAAAEDPEPDPTRTAGSPAPAPAGTAPPPG
jgi:hypothetical protein